jgi:hypothetical protein
VRVEHDAQDHQLVLRLLAEEALVRARVRGRVRARARARVRG